METESSDATTKVLFYKRKTNYTHSLVFKTRKRESTKALLNSKVDKLSEEFTKSRINSLMRWRGSKNRTKI